ncbi:hypothetical protein EKO29_02570 [Colwellia sp. Arc7-635]|uniref:hypothetical protein n=1 Tax=Colwellia sp. Arc7-635 TaxID=2497879 RepID=UPI000F85B30A|nr:hypothetical protein [Colwellia sp. Arc7-635]AZQ83040.1 hypothetical protein EKO29_02570 [Colwellia sp. Arc7-635]
MENTNYLIELLKEDSFPAVALLDGSWGSGKTHYIHSELKDKLELEFTEHKVHYLSLYGISNIDDFRDRIISLAITGNGNNSKFPSIISEVLSGTSQFFGEKGIGSIMNGISGAIKYKVYSELKNVVILLDDLERITNVETIQNILGECLNLAETKDIKIVVIANEEKITCKDDIEKVFNDKVKFYYSHEKIASILSKEFKSTLTQELNDVLLSLIEQTNSTNIRVLKRALVRFKKLKYEIEQVKGVNIQSALINCLRQVITVCYAKFERGFSIEEIKSATSTKWHDIDKEEHENEDKKRRSKLHKILHYGVDHEYLIDFCCNGKFLFKNIVNELRLPVNESPISQVTHILQRHKMTENDFNKGVLELINLINKKENIEIEEWYFACDTYIELIDNQYITDKNLSSENLLKTCKDKDVDCFKSIKKDLYVRQNHFLNEDIYKLFQEKTLEVRKALKAKQINRFNDAFISSWEDVRSNIYRNQEPFLKDINKCNFEKAITTWPNVDIINFTHYLHQRFDYNNIEDNYTSENNNIKLYVEYLNDFISKSEPSLRLGAIFGLKATLSSINTRLTERIALTTDT